MPKRKFFKTTFTVEVLSEEEPVSDDLSLEEIERGFTSGDWSGRVTCEGSEELSAQEAVYELTEQGSDPSFFRLTEDGEELDDESDEDEEEELNEDEEGDEEGDEEEDT